MARQNVLEIIIRGTDEASDVIDNVMGGAADKTKSLADNMLQVGASLTAISAPFAATLGVAVNKATDFEEAMTNVQAVLGVSNEEVRALSDEILLIGSRSRAGPQQAAEAFYDIVGGVADASSHMAILEASIQTAEAGSASLTGTTSALISVMNAYGFAAEDAGFASDVLTQIVGAGVGTMDEFAGALPQVAGLASSLGVSFNELGGEMAFITTQGFSASQAATQLRSLMTLMLNPSTDLANALNSIGYESGVAAIEQLGLAGTLEALNEATGGGAELAQLFGSNVEALNGVLALTKDGATEFLDEFSATVDGATQKAYDIQMGSVAAQFDIVRSSLDALAITVGNILLPHVGRLLDIVIQILPKVTEWADENPRLVETIAALTGVALVAGVTLTTLGLAVSLTATAFGGLATAVGAVKVVLAAMTGPIGLAILGVTALYGAYKSNFLGIRDFVQDTIKPKLEDFFDFLGGAGTDVKNAIDKIADKLSDGTTTVSEAVATYGPEILDAVLKGLGDLAQWTVDNIITPLSDSLTNEAVSLLQAVATYGPDILDKILASFGDFAEWMIREVITPLADSLINNAFKLGEAVVEYGPEILDAIIESLGDIPAWIEDHIITPFVDELTGGGPDVAGAVEGFGPDMLEKATKLVEDVSYEVGRLPGRIVPLLVEGAAEVAKGVVEYGPKILAEILKGLGDLAVWIFEHVITPWVNGLVDGVGDLKKAVENWAPDVLDWIEKKFGDLKQWVEDNIVNPIKERLENGVDDLIDGVSEWASNLLDTFLTGLGDLVQWALDNIISPITGRLEDGVDDLVLSVGEWATKLLDEFLDGLGDLAAWVLEHIITPIGSRLLSGDVDIAGGVINWATKLFEKFIEGLGDLGQWVLDNIISPVADGLTSEINLSSLLSSALGLGGDIVVKIAEGVGDLAQWAYDNIIKPIGDAIDSALESVTGAISDIAAEVDRALGRITELNNTTISPNITDTLANPTETLINPVGHQAGTPWTGSGPASMIAGFAHHREAIIPEGGMFVKPDPGGLTLRGLENYLGGGNGANITINVSPEVVNDREHTERNAFSLAQAVEMELNRRG